VEGTQAKAGPVLGAALTQVPEAVWTGGLLSLGPLEAAWRGATWLLAKAGAAWTALYQLLVVAEAAWSSALWAMGSPGATPTGARAQAAPWALQTAGLAEGMGPLMLAARMMPASWTLAVPVRLMAASLGRMTSRVIGGAQTATKL